MFSVDTVPVETKTEETTTEELKDYIQLLERKLAQESRKLTPPGVCDDASDSSPYQECISLCDEVPDSGSVSSCISSCDGAPTESFKQMCLSDK